MGPSDHQSFFMKQIPVLHFFTGTHGDYHRPSDDWDKINIAGTERIAELVEKVAVEVARLPERPKYVAVKGTANIEERQGSRPYFGSVPDFGTDKPGYALGGVAPGGPAEKAGLKAGDRIVQLGKSKIENLSDFDLALRNFSPGETVEVTVIRGDDRVVVKVVLDKPRGG
jgi:S1-C subfamily serine protease